MIKPSWRRAAALLSTAVMAVSLAGPVAAAEEPEFVTQQNWFECNGTTKLAAANVFVDGALPTWSTKAPTASVQSGAGCGAYELGALSGTTQSAVYDASFRGTFTGNIADIAMELHFIQPATAAFGDIALDLRVAIDGNEYDLGEQFIDGARTEQSASGASYATTFALNNIDIIDDPTGPGTKTHTYTITVMGHFIDTGGVIPFVWGTTEVPAGLTFNANTSGLVGVNVR